MLKKMLNNKGGFTLIELVMIIIILGILAAVAIPRYIDLGTEARRAVVSAAFGGVAGQLQITIANHRRAPSAANFQASVLNVLTREGWNFTNVATSGNATSFDIHSGTTYGTGDPYIRGTYNAETVSLTATRLPTAW